MFPSISFLLGVSALVGLVFASEPTECNPPTPPIDFSKLDKAVTYLQYYQPENDWDFSKCNKYTFAVDGDNGTMTHSAISATTGEALTEDVGRISPDLVGGVNVTFTGWGEGTMVNLFKNDDGYVTKSTFTMGGKEFETIAVVSELKEIADEKVDKLLEGACVQKLQPHSVNQTGC